MPDAYGNPLPGEAVANDTQSQQYWNSQQAAAQQAYNMAKLQGDSDQLAFSKAQAALAQANNIATQYGYAPGGNWLTWGPGGPTQPAAGTPTLAAQNQAMSQIGQQQQLATGIANVTGVYSQPMPLPYQPGTILRDPNGLVGVVNQDGSVTGFANQQQWDSYAASRGTTAQAMNAGAVPVSAERMQQLQMGPPTGLAQTSLAAQQQAAQAASSAAQQTGFYYQPQSGNIALDAWNARASADQKATYAAANGGNEAAAANQWWQDMQGAIAQSGQTPQQYVYGQGAPTLQMQALYGQYGAPAQGQETLAANQQYFQQSLDAQKQALAQWQAQQTAGQNYLSMMAGLRGPADWIQYQKVLGAAPQGLQQLAAAAAGQYVPGGGATTGVQPQAVSLGGFVNSATGGALGAMQQQNQQAGATQQAGGTQQAGAASQYSAWPNYGGAPAGYGQTQSNQDQTTAFQNSLVAPNQMAPQTWNNLTPSQQQMLLGTWESQGYTQDDAKALFSQSLPKYAGSGVAGTAGQFKLQ